MPEDVWAEAADTITTEAEQSALHRAEWDAKVAKYPVLGRGLADIRDKVGWAKVRSNRIGASDAASFATIDSVDRYIAAKLYNPFRGNSFTAHGNARETSMIEAFHVEQNFTLFGSAGNPRHVATPDGIKLGGDGTLILAQAKTTLQKLKTLKSGEQVPVPPFTNAKGFFHIPPGYQRQMWWEQYVMGADRTLFVWEEHVGGIPTTMEPESHWFYRDDAAIDKLIIISDLVLAGMDAAAEFERENQ